MRVSAKILLIGTLTAIPISAIYGEPLTKAQTCKNMHKLAKNIMDSRQQGMAMPDIIETVDGNPLFEYFIESAYDMPRYSTDEMQQRSIEDFANSIYAECWKNYKADN